MLRSVFKNSLLYFFSGILTRGISFFLLPLYTSILTQENYGSLEAISILSTITIMLFSFQINEGVARYYNELSNQRSIQIYTSTVLYFCLFSFSIFLLFATLFNPQLAIFYGIDNETTQLSTLSIFCNALYYFSQNQLTWKIKPVQESLAALTYNITAIGFSILFISYYRYGIGGIMMAQIIAACSGISVALLFTWRDFGPYFSFRILKKLLHFSFPLVPRALSVFLFLFTDRFCIRELLGLTALGIFSVGSKIASIMILINIGLASALSPLIYKHHKETDTPVKIGVIFRYYCFGGILIMAGLSYFSDEIIALFTNEKYLQASICIAPLASSIFFSSLLQFFPGLALSKKTKMMSIITVGASLLNLTLNLMLIREYGVFGSSLITSACFLLNFLLLYKYSQKEYWIDVNLIGLMSMMVLVYFTVFLIHYFQTPIYYNIFFYLITSWISWVTVLRKGDSVLILKIFKRAQNQTV